ncbi:reverse transcriptase [Lasius niger]|uniref:Reverse transcriptase n=1 Tax=Lasius niger TaxID=67767 RepID=A0A0J7KMG5_LASNI|nr:reverse transcriptase [Lasius niger]
MMRDNFYQEAQGNSLSIVRENALEILASFGNDSRIVYNQDVYSAIIAVMEHVDYLFSFADKMRHGKNYLLSRLRSQERQSTVHIHGPNSSDFVLSQAPHISGRMFFSSNGRLSAGNLTASNSSPRASPDCFSPSVLRGDDLEQARVNPSRLGTMLGPPPLNRRGVEQNEDQILIERIVQIEERIDCINSEIATKNASLQLMDVAAGHVLEDLVSNDNLEIDQRVGRARRRGGASRPRGGPPRTRSPKYNDYAMDNDKEITLPPQGIRTPSGRRESPTVPGALPSSSDAGPTLSSPTGGGLKVATVEEEPDPKDPLDLTFVDCTSMLEEEPRIPPQVSLMPETQSDLAMTSTPSRVTRSSKRKAKKTSPDAITPSSEEIGTTIGRVPKIVLRKVKDRSRKRKPRVVESEEDPNTAQEDISSVEMSTESDTSEQQKKKSTAKTISEEDSDVEYTGTEVMDPEYTNKLRSSGTKAIREPTKKPAKSPPQDLDRRVMNRKKKKDSFRIWSAAEDGEDDDTEFCPEDLKIMGATAIGAIGIDCLKTTEFERKNSPNINGAISGIMKRKIRRAADVINTLVFKAESKGDPTHLRIRNRELEAEVEKLRLEDVLRRREMEEMRTIVNDLKKEVYELKGRLDDAQEDARKARESYRITRRMMKRGGTSKADINVGWELFDDPCEGLGRELPQKPVVVPMDIEVTKSTVKPSEIVKPGKGKQSETRIEDINLKIKDLVRMKRELRRETELGGSEEGSSGPSRSIEKPLPQRIPKSRLRITSNIQVAPPKTAEKKVGFVRNSSDNNKTDSSRQGWSEVVNRKSKNKSQTSIAPRTPARETSKKIVTAVRRPPKTAAVMITGSVENFSYADALRKARCSVSLDKLEITKTKIRKAANGSLLIEVLGPGGAGKAIKLRDELHKVLKDEAKVTRPVTKGEIRLIGLHDATSPDEIVGAIADYEDHGGSCFRCGEEGHIARNCSAPPACKVCKMEGRTFNHRLGSFVSGATLSSRTEKVIVAGDFNAKATLWGSRITNQRGLQVVRWAAERDLRIVNAGDTPTCVRPQGSSIVDLTWSSPDLLPLIDNWQVNEDREWLSDHICISFDICVGRPSLPPIRGLNRRWNLRKFDRDFFKAALIWGSRNPELEDECDLSQSIRDLDRIMEEACDAAALRIGPRRPRRCAYWWSESAATLRNACIRARRSWQRAKRRSRSPTVIKELGGIYKAARKDLRLEINRLKARSWQELIESVDRDPWGLPYKLVLDEVYNALKKGPSSLTKAPGPDGFRLVLWKRAPEETIRWVTNIYNTCLKTGKFPDSWKCANLVLIPKANNANIDLRALDIPKARPICLLNELGKTFERVLAERIHFWQTANPDSDVSGFQYGFRKNRSTCDALLLVRQITSDAVRNGGFAFAVSLDISNAFNSIPWRKIRRALRDKGYPKYIQRILDSYFSNRVIRFLDRNGRWDTRNMEAGVPQGSVLGPVLWNVAFDEVLNLAEEDEGNHVVCYADDTLIIVTGKDLKTTQLRASILVARAIIVIKRLGLSVAKEKTEAILFHSRGTIGLPASIMVEDTSVKFSSSIKYLGVIIDSNWLFSEHFRYIEGKAGKVVRALNRLMPNLRGPDERRRRLFANVVLSVILYGAPVWGDVFVKKSCAQPALYRLQRSVAQRVISAYRTVSSNAALLLARLPPLKLLATSRKNTYDRIRELRRQGNVEPVNKKEIKESEFAIMCNSWRAILEKPNTPGEFTKLFIVPRLEDWLTRDTVNSLSFHLTQALTDHGCFSKYLCRIQKRPDSTCFMCGMDDEDDALHTLRDCPTWDTRRLDMRKKLGLPRDFNMSDVIESIMSSREIWIAFSSFVESIMREKEDEERRLEGLMNQSSSSSPPSSFVVDDESGSESS